MKLSHVSLRSLRVWQRNRDVFLSLWKAELLPPIVEPVIMILAMGLGLGAYIQLSGNVRYIQFLTPGVLAVFPMFAATFECLWGSYFRMEMQKTFQAVIATPVNIEDVIAGEIFWGATRTLISSGFILAVALAFTPAYGLVRSPLAVLIVPLSLLQGLMFASMAMSYTSVAYSLSSLSYFFSLFITPMFWFSGVFFPLDRLPHWVQTLSWFIPITHVVEVYRGLVTGHPHLADLGHLAWMAIVSLFFFYLSLSLMRRRLIR